MPRATASNPITQQKSVTFGCLTTWDCTQHWAPALTASRLTRRDKTKLRRSKATGVLVDLPFYLSLSRQWEGCLSACGGTEPSGWQTCHILWHTPPGNDNEDTTHQRNGGVFPGTSLRADTNFWITVLTKKKTVSVKCETENRQKTSGLYFNQALLFVILTQCSIFNQGS